VFQRRQARVLLAVLVFAALVLVTIDFRGSEDGPVDRLRGIATAAFAPVQDGVAWLVRPLGEAAGSLGELFSLRSENQRLRDRVASLEERRRTFTDLAQEHAELQELLAMRDATALPTVAARAVALAPSNFEWTITIDVGADDGVERNMPVVNGQGLVGRVIQVGATSARVLLAIDPSFAAPARLAASGAVGSIEGRGGDPMLLRLLGPAGTVEVGDEVVTSTYQGGIFPAGIPVGVVTAAAQAGRPLSPELAVSPFVDFSRLDHVLVVMHRPTESLPPFNADVAGGVNDGALEADEAVADGAVADGGGR